MREEMERIRREDEALMRVKLGLEPNKDMKQVLSEINDPSDERMMLNKLTDYELKELIAKGGTLP